MKINSNKNDNNLMIALEGRLDSNTSVELDDFLQTALNDIVELTFDFSNLSYVSSAGLRVILMAQKRMSKQGHMFIDHVNSNVMEVFEITGFAAILTIR